jgi:hypothetical protein
MSIYEDIQRLLTAYYRHKLLSIFFWRSDEPPHPPVP